MTRFGYAFAVATALLGLAGMLQPAKATTIVYTITADDPSLGGQLDLSFPSAGFLVPPVGTENLTISNATTCIVLSGPCTSNPTYFDPGASPPSIEIRLANGDSGIATTFLTADFGAVGTYQSIDDAGLVTMTVNAATTPEPSTWAMLLLGFAGLGFVGYRSSRRLAASAA